jgi:hypothetical protein
MAFTFSLKAFCYIFVMNKLQSQTFQVKVCKIFRDPQRQVPIERATAPVLCIVGLEDT